MEIAVGILLCVGCPIILYSHSQAITLAHIARQLLFTVIVSVICTNLCI